ncbi:hypothetical protein MauCBS54593_001729 [Microsporum audouinii]
MTKPTKSIALSIIWSAWKTEKGAYSATVTVPEVDILGKWILITGSNNGIGREAAIQFAKRGANLILACRQPPSYETHPEQECDMADFSSIEALAKRWNESGRPLDVLVNNAGNIDPVFWALNTLFICFAIDSYQGSLALVNAATMLEFGLQAAGTDEFRGGAGYFNRIWMDDPSPYT